MRHERCWTTAASDCGRFDGLAHLDRQRSSQLRGELLHARQLDVNTIAIKLELPDTTLLLTACIEDALHRLEPPA